MAKRNARSNAVVQDQNGEEGWLSGSLSGWGEGKNVKDMKVPDVLRQKFQTGINYFDLITGGIVTTGKSKTDSCAGGPTPSAVYLFTGTPGAGKTTLLESVADAVTGAGGIALCNTREESLYQVALRFERIGHRNGFVVKDHAFVEDIIEHADRLRAKNPDKQFVLMVDSLQTTSDDFYDKKRTKPVINSKTPLRVLAKLVRWAKGDIDGKGNNITGRKPPIVLVIGHVTKGGDFAGDQSLVHLVDGHMHLSVDDQKRSETFGYRLFTMKKNRFGSAGLTYVLDMGPKGLIEMGDISSHQSGDDDDE